MYHFSIEEALVKLKRTESSPPEKTKAPIKNDKTRMEGIPVVPGEKVIQRYQVPNKNALNTIIFTDSIPKRDTYAKMLSPDKKSLSKNV